MRALRNKEDLEDRGNPKRRNNLNVAPAGTAVPTKSIEVLENPSRIAHVKKSLHNADSAGDFQEILLCESGCGCARVARKPKHTAATFFDRGGFLPDNGKPASQCR